MEPSDDLWITIPTLLLVTRNLMRGLGLINKECNERGDGVLTNSIV